MWTVGTTSRNVGQEAASIATRGAFVPPKTPTVTLRAWKSMAEYLKQTRVSEQPSRGHVDKDSKISGERLR